MSGRHALRLDGASDDAGPLHEAIEDPRALEAVEAAAESSPVALDADDLLAVQAQFTAKLDAYIENDAPLTTTQRRVVRAIRAHWDVTGNPPTNGDLSSTLGMRVRTVNVHKSDIRIALRNDPTAKATIEALAELAIMLRDLRDTSSDAA